MSTIKFEKGKFYKTRGGQKAECVYTDLAGDEPLLFIVEGTEDYFPSCPDGMYFGGRQESQYDIISEWVEERVVWVVWSGWSGSAFVYDLYPEAFRFFTALYEHPANSLTRVVIQDGHVDTE